MSRLFPELTCLYCTYSYTSVGCGLELLIAQPTDACVYAGIRGVSPLYEVNYTMMDSDGEPEKAATDQEPACT